MNDDYGKPLAASSVYNVSGATRSPGGLSIPNGEKRLAMIQDIHTGGQVCSLPTPGRFQMDRPLRTV
jgi:hypothetical protein